jgi:DNA-binding MarR family transcriptional regulator
MVEYPTKGTMAKQPFDVNELERIQTAYLKALYEKERAEKSSIGAIIGMNMGEAATALSISKLQVDRAVTDLEAEGLINAMGGTSYSLTVDGRNRIEWHLHETHRPWYKKLREKLGSPAVIGGVAGFITSMLVNVLAASDMPWWLKLLLGKK